MDMQRKQKGLAIHENLYRYDGLVASPFVAKVYGMSNIVPLVPLTDLLPQDSSMVHFVKIDTDSIDCDILGQLLLLIKSNMLLVQSISFESSGLTGCDLGEKMHQLQELGYTLFRTLLWQVKFSGKGGFPEVFSHEKPDYADELFDLRFNRYLWRFHNMSVPTWQNLANKKSWQYFATTQKLTSNGIKISEKT
eukprot:gnl/MRDRNA2_/MRDRNA2_85463_c0_seq1.p1 gnl/MRDRNA2_/MRDRNA2_85463_c0~~gnl/MRDRNA2_/MRDRNA2_85463_c0_seq1.p1  ORF type:complete len:193 (-),score=19.03 gnl/MRDRNA2_/MRDRNA2_85463_c0_seq1:145-723(-)